MILFILDLTGTFIFALTGALKAVRHRLDWLGIMVLASITGVGGGVMRDVILGSTPPAAFHNEWYLVCSLAAGLFTIIFIPLMPLPRTLKVKHIILIGDAVGLGVFTFIGAAKGMNEGLGPVGILFTGVVTSCGGGIIRDVLVKEIPAVLRRDFYATASLLGSLLFFLLKTLDMQTWVVPVAVIFFTTALRLLAMKTHMSLPVPQRK